ncbi:MAG: hypothetical protein U0231_10435 [Nitrospiraceae bacterium]
MIHKGSRTWRQRSIPRIRQAEVTILALGGSTTFGYNVSDELVTPFYRYQQQESIEPGRSRLRT